MTLPNQPCDSPIDSTPTLYKNKTDLDKFNFSLQSVDQGGIVEKLPSMSAHLYTNLCLNKDLKQKRGKFAPRSLGPLKLRPAKFWIPQSVPCGAL